MAFTALSSGSTNLYCMNEGDLQSGVGNLWMYRSSDAGVTIGGTTGYFAGMGYGSRGGAPIGMRIGDVVFAVETTAGATPGRVTLHGVVSSTANGSTSGFVQDLGYDVSVQLHAST